MNSFLLLCCAATLPEMQKETDMQIQQIKEENKRMKEEEKEWQHYLAKQKLLEEECERQRTAWYESHPDGPIRTDLHLDPKRLP